MVFIFYDFNIENYNNFHIICVHYIIMYRLESLSRRLELSGPQGVTIESRAGDIIVSCLMDVKLESIAGAVRIYNNNKSVIWMLLCKIANFMNNFIIQM